MRILVLSNMYPPHHLGGYELSCRDVMERLRARGHDVSILTTTMRLPGVSDAPDESARDVRRSLTFYWEDHRIRNPSIVSRVRMEKSNHAVLRSVLASFRPDVVSV